MKSFIVKVLLGSAIALIILVGTIVARLAYHTPAFDAAFTLHPQQRLVCMGDSHIGTSIIEDPAFETKLLWNSSASTRFTLLRLLELERKEALHPPYVIITELNYQSLYAEESATARLLSTLFPIAWRQAHLFTPSELWKATLEIAKNCGVGPVEDAPTRTISILELSPEERTRILQQNTNGHFNHSLEARQSALQCRFEELTAIHAVCKRNRVPLVVFSAPLCSFYQQAVPDYAKADFNRLLDYLNTLEIPYLDFRQADGIHDGHFVDGHHLSVCGRETFTPLFRQHLIPMLNTLTP